MPEPAGYTPYPRGKVVPGGIPSRAAGMLGLWRLNQVWLGAQCTDLDHMWSPKMYTGAPDMAQISGTFWKG